MSLIRISQYKKDNLPRELSTQMYEMARHQTRLPFSISDGVYYLLAFSQNKLAGFIEIQYKDELATIRNVAIDGAYSRSRITLKLTRAALMQSIKYDCQRVQLACLEPNVKHFKRAGFYETNTSQEGDDLIYTLENPCPEYYLQTQNQQKDPQKKLNSLIIKEDSETHNFNTEAHYIQLHHSMMAQARKQVWILMDAPTNPVLNNEYTSQCLLRLIKRNPQSEIRLLLANDKSGAGYYNPTINLAQRLSSHIEIRTLSKTGMPFKEMITLVDFSGSIYRRSLSSKAGFANFYNPLMTTRLRNNFEHHWSFSKPSFQLRRLVI